MAGTCGALGALGVILAFDVGRDFYALEWPPAGGMIATAVITIGSMVVLDVSLRWLRPHLGHRIK